jgi:SAM-dependent methyltransferase
MPAIEILDGSAPKLGSDSDYKELLLGCGYNRKRLLGGNPANPPEALPWRNLTTVDNNPDCNPDTLWDLNSVPWPFDLHSFDEVHAYEILEYLGRQGDVLAFYDTFNEIHRILKPDGLLFATTASKFNAWLWGDPGRTRAIMQESLMFLDRRRWNDTFETGAGISDYRRYSQCDFDVLASEDNHVFHIFCLQAKKPMRPFLGGLLKV